MAMVGTREAFERLSTVLQPADAGPEELTRGTLLQVVDRVLSDFPGFAFEVIPENPATCPNCAATVASTRTPYCSEHCKDMAAFVRQFRQSVDSGSLFERDRQVGMGQALWKLQGGGYPLRQTMVPARVLAKVIEREGGICSVCGAPATEIDHTGSG